MYIRSRSISFISRLSLSLLSGFASWLLFYIFGNSAWRLFPAWVMLIATIYYIVAAFVTLIRRKRDAGKIVCPMLQGAIIVSGILLAIFRLVVNYANLQVVGLEGVGIVLVDFALPVLYLLDWILFTKKGDWRVIDPLYWLALPACYVCFILLSAEFMRTSVMQYPYEFLDFYAVGLDMMLTWFVVLATLILILGYLFVVIDFVMSGKLGKYIVLPHIKTIVIEEEAEDISKKPTRSAVKSEATKSAPAKQAHANAAPKIAKATGSVKAQGSSDGDGKSRDNSKSMQKANVGTSPKSPIATVAKEKSKKQEPVALLEAHSRSAAKKKNEGRTEKASAPKNDKV